MGKKKVPFIDKKSSTTYSLTYGIDDSEDAAPDGVSIAPGSQARYAPYDDGESFYGSESSYAYGQSQYDDDGYVMTEARRKELIGLGFPDDGYDYLHHMKDLGPTQRRKPSSRRPRGSSKKVDSVAVAGSSSSGPDASSSAAAAAPAAQPAGEGGSSSSDEEQHAGAAGAGSGSDDDDGEAEPSVGPSVYINGKFIPPEEDVKLLDARRLVVQGRVEDDLEAEKAIATVTAFAREHQSKLTRGRLLHDLEEIEKSMALVEGKHESGKKGKAAKPKEMEGSSIEQVLSKVGDDGSDEEEWGDWFDDFVVAAAKDDPIPEGTEEAEEEEEEEEDVEEAEAGAGEEGRGKEAGAAAEGSIASSYWRPERQDRKGELAGIDDRFEQLATQYEDEALGELDDEDAAKARNNGNIADFAGMLDEFLLEQAEMEAVLDEEQQQGTTKNNAASRAAARAVAELGEDIADYVGGDEYDGVHGLGGSDDEEGGRGGRRLRAEAPGDATAGPAPVYRKFQALNQIDPEVIAKTRERIAIAEAEAIKRIERPVNQTLDDEYGGLAGEAGDLFNEQLQQTFVERDDKWDCESVLSLRSNLENHPARIAEPQRRTGTRGGGAIKLSFKTGMPLSGGGPNLPAAVGGLSDAVAAGVGALTLSPETVEAGVAVGGPEDAGAVSSSDGSDNGHLEEEGSVVYLERRKDETADEKRMRKASVKDAKREARASKKSLKIMFKEEGTKQRRQAAGRSLGAPTGGSTFVIA